MEAIENGALLAYFVDVWGFEDRVAVTTQVIRSLLIGDDENEIGLFLRHDGFRLVLGFN